MESNLFDEDHKVYMIWYITGVTKPKLYLCKFTQFNSNDIFFKKGEFRFNNFWYT